MGYGITSQITFEQKNKSTIIKRAITMLSFEGIYADAAILTFGMQFVGFAVAAILQTEVFYDVLGGINFLALAVFSFLEGLDKNGSNAVSNDKVGASFNINNGVFAAFFALSRGWLLVFLAWRAHHRKGDSRFDGVRTVPSKFFVYWMVQAIWVYCISLPLLAVAANETAAADADAATASDQDLNDVDLLRSLLLLGMAFSIFVEIWSDIVKAGWVARGRPGGFCRDGLWKHSRHPNYAGEISTWVFAAVYATCVCDWSWTVATIASISPVFTVQILLNTSGTGVWNAEGKNLKRYYENENQTVAKNYEEYRETTPPLFPTFFVPYETIPLEYQRRFCFEWERYEFKKSSKGKHNKQE